MRVDNTALDVMSILQKKNERANEEKSNFAGGFASLLKSALRGTASVPSAASASTVPAPGSLDEWLQAKIASTSTPKTVEDAAEKAEQLSSYLSGIFSSAFKEAGIPGSYGLAASYADGEFTVTARLVPIFINQLIIGENGLVTSGGIQTGDEAGPAEPAPKPMDSNYYREMMARMVDECLKELLDSEQSDTLGEFSFNKAIVELSKFKPEFKEAFNKEPSSALNDYREDIVFYMENALFPVAGD